MTSQERGGLDKNMFPERTSSPTFHKDMGHEVPEGDFQMHVSHLDLGHWRDPNTVPHRA